MTGAASAQPADGPSGAATAVESVFDRGLPHMTPTYRALGFDFAVRCDDPVLLRYLTALFEPFEVHARPGTTYSLGSIEDAGEPLFLLYRDDVLEAADRVAAEVVATLLWHVNRRVVSDSQDRLLVHASAVAQDGVALLFPAAMEAGKSTLAAGLVRAGLDYLTDETVALDVGRGVVEPFPRALSIDPGSWKVLADLRPDVPPGAERYVGDQWQVPPQAIRPGSVAASCRVGHVITPRYRDGAVTELRPLTRADAVVTLAENSFNFHRFGGEGLQLLANVVRGASCHRLVIGDLDVACGLVLDLLATGQDQGRPTGRSDGGDRDPAP